MHVCMSRQQKNLVHALWQEVPKLVYAFWICNPVIWSRMIWVICFQRLNVVKSDTHPFEISLDIHVFYIDVMRWGKYLIDLVYAGNTLAATLWMDIQYTTNNTPFLLNMYFTVFCFNHAMLKPHISRIPECLMNFDVFGCNQCRQLLVYKLC